MWSATKDRESDNDITHTFPTRDEAEAFAEMRNRPVESAPVPAPAPVASIDWKQRRWDAALAAPEPPQSWWGSGVKTASGYARWNFQYADALIAASKERGE